MNNTPHQWDLEDGYCLAHRDCCSMVETIRYCATCGEPEGSDYAKHCCTEDNLIED